MNYAEERDYKEIERKIVEWLKAYLEQSRRGGFVVGLSGGVDSSVTAVLCRRVTPATLGLLLPCGDTPPDALADAQLVASKFDIETAIYDLTPVYQTLLRTLGAQDDPRNLAVANLKPRLRMITLYYEANRLQRLVAGTGNRTELTLGYFTKYGDAGVDILPLGSLLKREVRGLARHLGIPDRIIEKPPTAGLWPGQTDEGELGATYDQLDDLVAGATPKGLSPSQVERLRRLINESSHKRQTPPICPL